MSAFILLLHVLGWGVLVGVVAPQHSGERHPVLGVGLGLYRVHVGHAARSIDAATSIAAAQTMAAGSVG